MLVPVGGKRALSTIQEELANSLVAVYLHGSAVAGGLPVGQGSGGRGEGKSGVSILA